MYMKQQFKKTWKCYITILAYFNISFKNQRLGRAKKPQIKPCFYLAFKLKTINLKKFRISCKLLLIYITDTYILSIFKKSNETNEYTCSNPLSKPRTCWITSFQKWKGYLKKVLGKKSLSERSLLDSTLWNFLRHKTWAEIQVLWQGVAALRNCHKFFILFAVFRPSSWYQLINL